MACTMSHTSVLIRSRARTVASRACSHKTEIAVFSSSQIPENVNTMPSHMADQSPSNSALNVWNNPWMMSRAAPTAS